MFYFAFDYIYFDENERSCKNFSLPAKTWTNSFDSVKNNLGEVIDRIMYRFTKVYITSAIDYRAQVATISKTLSVGRPRTQVSH